MNNNIKNIVLIGMPASGKSTTGVILAKTLGMQYIDTDLIIQNCTDSLLQSIIDKKGMDGFIKTEGEIIAGLNVTNHVIATGGSAVYSGYAMEVLRRNSTIIYLKLNCDEIEHRLKNILTRGIVSRKGMSIQELYKERRTLYEKYADIEINCDNKDIERVVTEIVSLIR